MGISDFIMKQKQAFREREQKKFSNRAEALKTLQEENKAREQKLAFMRAEEKAKDTRRAQRKEIIQKKLGGLKNLKTQAGSLRNSFGSGSNPFKEGQTVNRAVWGGGSGSGFSANVWTGSNMSQPKKKKQKGKGGRSITIKY